MLKWAPSEAEEQLQLALPAPFGVEGSLQAQGVTGLVAQGELGGMSVRFGAASTEKLKRSVMSRPSSEPSTSWAGARRDSCREPEALLPTSFTEGEKKVGNREKLTRWPKALVRVPTRGESSD